MVKPGRKPEPNTEAEQLAYYKALHLLSKTASVEDAINDELIALYREQAEYITMIKPFMSWREIGELMGISAFTIRARYESYAENPVKD